MAAALKRPSFSASFLAALVKSEKRRGNLAFIPIWLIACLAIGGGVACFIPAKFWNYEKLEVATAVYVGILTLNGLILALSWSAFARMHESISDAPFSDYLLQRDLLNDYIFYINFINVAQITALLICALALLLMLCDVGVIYNRVAFAIMIGTSAYAIKQASSAVSAMHDLIWQKAIFDGHTKGNPPGATIVVRKEEERAKS
jgi:hypothetical protein